MKFFINKKSIETESESGFTLLFSILVATLVVAIGATVVSIAVRQTILSGTTRESQYAFYAANTVMECAFYWDVVGLPFAPGIPTGTVFRTPLDADTFEDFVPRNELPNYASCAGDGLSITDVGDTGTFTISINDESTEKDFTHEYCATASVTKTRDEVDGTIFTTIEAKGYNNACDNLDNPRTVERGLIQKYES